MERNLNVTNVTSFFPPKTKSKIKCYKCEKLYGNKERLDHHDRMCSTGKKTVLNKCSICDKH